jgi:hypothetical protein
MDGQKPEEGRLRRGLRFMRLKVRLPAGGKREKTKELGCLRRWLRDRADALSAAIFSIEP